jgi:transposase
MIGPPPGTRVYLACGVTDMRSGMDRLATLVQQSLSTNPFDGAVYLFRGRKGRLVKALWHDGVGLCLFVKRLEHGHFPWPTTPTGSVTLSPAQASLLLEGLEWRTVQREWRPTAA